MLITHINITLPKHKAYTKLVTFKDSGIKRRG